MKVNDLSASLRRVWIQLTADRRRFGVLCATFGVGLLLWARLIIVSNVSRTAVADQPAVGTSGKDETKRDQTRRAADKPGATDSTKGAALARTALEVRLSSRCERDPFVISPVYFPKALSSASVKPEAGKLPTEPAEDASQKQARVIARLRQLLGSVRLEAAMGSSMAVIDGKRYRVGDVLPPMGSERVEFTLSEVKQRSVILEYQGHRFEIEMSVPGASGN